MLIVMGLLAAGLFVAWRIGLGSVDMREQRQRDVKGQIRDMGSPSDMADSDRD